MSWCNRGCQAVVISALRDPRKTGAIGSSSGGCADAAVGVFKHKKKDQRQRRVPGYTAGYDAADVILDDASNMSGTAVQIGDAEGRDDVVMAAAA